MNNLMTSSYKLTCVYVAISLVSIFFALSTSSFMTLWITLEISSLFFVPILTHTPSLGSVESKWKYFITQALGSTLLLLSFNMSEMSSSHLMKLIWDNMMVVSLLMKLGAWPFGSWFVHLCESLSWWSFFFVSSLQKIIPLIILSKMNLETGVFIISLSLIVLPFFMFTNSSFRWLLSYSSMYNTNWLALASCVSFKCAMTYMFMYFLTFFCLLMTLSSSSLKKMSTISINSGSWSDTSLKLMIVFFTSGFPPLGVFIPKIELIFCLQNNFVMPVLLVISSSLVMLFYVKVASLMSMSMEKDFFKKVFRTFSIVIMIMITLSSILGWII
nr:NADH dehydrogenase subunit 2 [Osculotes curta]